MGRSDEQKSYAYVASMVSPCFTTSDYNMMSGLPGMHGDTVLDLTQFAMAPNERQERIQSELDKAVEIMGWPQQLTRVAAGSKAAQFLKFPEPAKVFGKGHVAAVQKKSIITALKAHGMGHFHPEQLSPRLVGICLGCTEKELNTAKVALGAVRTNLESMGLKLSGAAEPPISLPQARDAKEVVSQFRQKAKLKPGDAVLLFGSGTLRSAADGVREALKFECMQAGAQDGGTAHIASQWFDLGKFTWKKLGTGGDDPNNDFSIANVVVALAAKLGHVPFFINATWASGDSQGRETVVAGVDICHFRGSGAMHRYAAATRIGFRDPATPHHLGALEPEVRQVDSETIPGMTWRKLIPKRFVEGRVVILHRDGYFKDEELNALQLYQEALNASGTAFVLVEVVKDDNGTPRLYSGGINPEAGYAMMLGEKDALVATAEGRKGSTAEPVHVRRKAVFGSVDNKVLKQGWIRSVFDLSFLHHGSLFRSPKLPASIHFSDRAAYFMTRAAIKKAPIDGFELGSVRTQQAFL